MSTAYCFDLDGTLTTLELLPCIAAEVGLAEEIATLTRVTMDGHVSFEQSMRLRTALLGSVDLDRVHAVVRDVPLHPELAAFVAARPDDCYVVTGNLDVWLEPLVARLGCAAFTSRAAYDDARRLRVSEVLDKGDAVRTIRARGYDQVVAVGDGANDVPMFLAADVAIAYGGVHSPARAAALQSDFIVHEGRQLCRLLEGL